MFFNWGVYYKINNNMQTIVPVYLDLIQAGMLLLTDIFSVYSQWEPFPN